MRLPSFGGGSTCYVPSTSNETQTGIFGPSACGKTLFSLDKRYACGLINRCDNEIDVKVKQFVVGKSLGKVLCAKSDATNLLVAAGNPRCNDAKQSCATHGLPAGCATNEGSGSCKLEPHDPATGGNLSVAVTLRVSSPGKGTRPPGIKVSAAHTIL